MYKLLETYGSGRSLHFLSVVAYFLSGVCHVHCLFVGCVREFGLARLRVVTDSTLLERLCHLQQSQSVH